LTPPRQAATALKFFARVQEKPILGEARLRRLKDQEIIFSHAPKMTLVRRRE
jgi:hypothetical protein